MQAVPTDSLDQAAAPYKLPELPYGFKDLSPVIDETTMHLHHDKHHQAYTDGINAALSKHPEWHGIDIEEVLGRLSELPMDIREAVRNQGGGYANHKLFWKVLTPFGSGIPPVDLTMRMNRDFGSFDCFRKRFVKAGRDLFGSGWVFLAADPAEEFSLKVIPTSNQDSVVSRGYVALLACDVWEHAYYLKYNNRRGDWLDAWWDIVDWRYVAERLDSARVARSAG